MPKNLVRLLLVLLLAAGVPLRAVAALGGGLCGAHGHDAVAAASDHAAQLNEGPGAGPGAAVCPACASCGVAEAITHAPALLAPMPPVAGVAAAEFPASPGVVPEALDRPPLTILS